MIKVYVYTSISTGDGYYKYALVGGNILDAVHIVKAKREAVEYANKQLAEYGYLDIEWTEWKKHTKDNYSMIFRNHRMGRVEIERK